ncbi:uncharacterized protein LOC129586828 [Paramacrobiotus metropolitanus]|uniref:uncharacterized protein LOC129586828 n=1 Tax=Paramacrobiotus metropolitanus TaxID=2943436 RepID=UPI0024463A12|nr:uncharacterized protein LOC129586828 [Paramacrobiotus metropolitanus]
MVAILYFVFRISKLHPCTTHWCFTPWDQWSPCDATCGPGIRQRYRACYPLHAVCNGTVTETEKCQLKTCPNVGIWSVWSEWAPCTRRCGIGTMSRTRSCLSTQGVCSGGNKEVKLCNTHACKATGGWSAWGEWSSCSSNCGPGVRYQDRTCEDPPPSNGGPACHGAGTRVAHCFEKPCLDETTSVGVFNGNSFLLYPKTMVLKRMLTMYVKFRPDQQDGVIIYRHHGNDTSRTRNDTIILRLESGMVDLFIQFGGISQWLTVPFPLTMKQWHDVFVTFAGAKVAMRVDNGHPIDYSFPNLEVENVDLDQHMFVGGLSPPFVLKTKISYPGFIGHVATVRINYEDYFIEPHTGLAVSEESNRPSFSHDVELTEMDSDQLYPIFNGDDYITFLCKDCHGKPNLEVEIVIKPFQTDNGLIWISYGEEPGSFVALYFRKGSIFLCMNMGLKKRCTSTEVVPKNEWLAISFALSGIQIKLRLNHERAQILVADGHQFVARSFLHFAGGEQELWSTIYMMTRQTRGFEGILFSLKINKKVYDVRNNVGMRETGRLVSSETTSVAARYDEYHEPPVTDLEFICDLSDYVDLLDGQQAYLFWLKESEIIQNFTGIEIQKVPGMKHSSKMSVRSIEANTKDGFYGCLLRTDHHEILTHVFGVSFDDANETDIVEVAETAVLAIVLGLCLFVIIALLVLLKLGCLRRFPSYNAIIRHLPSWFTEGHRKDFLRRHSTSLKKSGIYNPEEIHRVLTMQQKSIQASSEFPRGFGRQSVNPPSTMADAPRGSRTSRPSLQQSVNEFIPPPVTDALAENTPLQAEDNNLLAYDPDSDYETPIARQQSEGTFFPPPVTEPYRRSTRISMRVPDHVRKNPDAFLPVGSRSGNRNSWQRSSKKLSIIPDTGESELTQSTEPTSVTPSLVVSQNEESGTGSETTRTIDSASSKKDSLPPTKRSAQHHPPRNEGPNQLLGEIPPGPATADQPQPFQYTNPQWPYTAANNNIGANHLVQPQPGYAPGGTGGYTHNVNVPVGQMPYAGQTHFPPPALQNPVSAPYAPQWRAQEPAFMGYPMQPQSSAYPQTPGYPNQQPTRPFFYQ